jgi:hypothetical protein
VDERSQRKIEKIEALSEHGRTEGERAAAAAALKRIQDRGPVVITSTIMDLDRGETFYEVAYLDLEGRQQICRIPRALFQRPAKVIDELLRVGAALSDKPSVAKKHIQDAVDRKSDKVTHLTGRAGWCEANTFVYPGNTFGKNDGRVFYERRDGLDPALGLIAGSLEAWREGLRRPCKHSDYLIMLIGAKASNAILEAIGEDEACILHLHGMKRRANEKSGSSSGKTLATMTAASMTGRCQRRDLPTFSISESAVCDLCFARSHLGVELDEQGRSFGHTSSVAIKADHLSYLLTSGRGSVRSNFATRQPDLQNRTWLTGGITSGEFPLDGNEIARTEGAQVRMIALPVPPGSKGGIFNRIKAKGEKRRKRCVRLAAQVEKTIAANYGVAFPAFLAAIVPERDKCGPRLSGLIDMLVSKVGADENPWERRFARKLAIGAATAILLSELEIGPWSKGRAIRAFVHIYRKARAAVSTIEEAADRFRIRIRRLLRKDRFPALPKGRKASARELRIAEKGFRRQLPHIGEVLLMPLKQVEQLVGGRRAEASCVLDELADKGIVLRGSDGKLTRQISLPGQKDRKRLVCFDLGAIAGDS